MLININRGNLLYIRILIVCMCMVYINTDYGEFVPDWEIKL